MLTNLFNDQFIYYGFN